MVIQQIDVRSLGADASGGPDRAAAVVALATVWLAKLATSFDWGSPNLGTGMIFTIAASALRLIAARLARPRALRSLVEPALAIGVVAVLVCSGAWSAATLSAQPQGSVASARPASAISALALGLGPVVMTGPAMQSPSGGGVSSQLSAAASRAASVVASGFGGEPLRGLRLALRRSAYDPTESGGGVDPNGYPTRR